MRRRGTVRLIPASADTRAPGLVSRDRPHPSSNVGAVGAYRSAAFRQLPENRDRCRENKPDVTARPVKDADRTVEGASTTAPTRATAQGSAAQVGRGGSLEHRAWERCKTRTWPTGVSSCRTPNATTRSGICGPAELPGFRERIGHRGRLQCTEACSSTEPPAASIQPKRLDSFVAIRWFGRRRSPVAMRSVALTDTVGPLTVVKQRPALQWVWE